MQIIHTNRKNTLELRLIDWEMIEVVWRDNLWPGREDIPVWSAMLPFGGHNATASSKDECKFIGLFVDDKLAGVNSVHPTGDGFARSRGLYVFEEFRGNGYGVDILNETKRIAEEVLDCKFLWSLPKRSSWSTYAAAGFERYTDWSNDYEFGPNAHALIKLI